MRLCGTTAHSAVASTSYSQNGLAGPPPRLGDRRGLPHQFGTLGAAFLPPQHARQTGNCPAVSGHTALAPSRPLPLPLTPPPLFLAAPSRAV